PEVAVMRAVVCLLSLLLASTAVVAAPAPFLRDRPDREPLTLERVKRLLHDNHGICVVSIEACCATNVWFVEGTYGRLEDDRIPFMVARLPSNSGERPRLKVRDARDAGSAPTDSQHLQSR